MDKSGYLMEHDGVLGCVGCLIAVLTYLFLIFCVGFALGAGAYVFLTLFGAV